MAKDRDAIKTVARKILHDDIASSGESPDVLPDVLDIHVDQALVEVSQACPYGKKETVVSDGTIDISLSSIEGLIGDKVEKLEYPVGNNPPDYIHNFTIFGDTLTIQTGTAPTSGQNIYLYCLKVHQLTKALSTLTADLERVLIHGAVAYAALAWLSKMRAEILPKSVQWYQGWANNYYIIYKKGLDDLEHPKSWEF